MLSLGSDEGPCFESWQPETLPGSRGATGWCSLYSLDFHERRLSGEACTRNLYPVGQKLNQQSVPPETK